MNFQRIVFAVVFAIPFPVITVAQTPDTVKSISLESYTVSSFTENSAEKTAVNISAFKIDSLSKYGNYNLTDLLARTPGISMLTTGVAIAKPVIRGLYGNRITVLLSGLKFDNQQWQEEHGLGLSDFGLNKVEVIKGPLSVLYGTEAIGGVINLIEEQKAALNKHETDYSVRLNSNTLGGLTQLGCKVNRGNRWFRIRVGIENNADYSDGNNQRVLNSRFDGYYLKSTFGFTRKNWTSNTNFSSSYNRFGFIFNDIYDFVKADQRWKRDLSVNPAHMVLLNILSSENKLNLKDGSQLIFNSGIQSNERLENEGGGAISLNMHLFTFQYLLKWEKQLNEKNKLILSNLGSYENNTNFGARKIIPDADMQESNLAVYVQTFLTKKLLWENGVGAGDKLIKTYLTASVNGPEKEVHPFKKFSPYYNFFSGLSYSNQKFTFKINAASGVRIPNLAELSSNGLHEGVFTYEIGSPYLKNEQNISLNFLTNYSGKYLELNFSPFYNHFYNYVYLAPTNEDWFGFPVFRYRQQDADQYGTEATITAKPSAFLRIGTSYSGMVSKTTNGNFTPYIPAQKLSSEINYSLYLKGPNKIHFFAAADYYFAQNNIYQNELATPSYKLLRGGISTSFKNNAYKYDIGLTGNNLLNEAYYDHLSRFKYFGILNIGRNIVLTIKVSFQSDAKILRK